jgi:glutamate racemase
MRAAEGGDAIDVIVLACTHFPLLADEIAAAWPGVALVDGGAGIARRIAHLTAGQPWPDHAPPGIAVFTAPPSAALAAALARFGLSDVVTL